MVYKRRIRSKKRFVKPVTAPVKRYVKSQFTRRVEKKCFQQFYSRLEATTSGLVTNITSVPRSTLGSGRIGNDIDFHKLHLRFEFFQKNSIILNLDDHNNVRLIVFQWKPEWRIDPPGVEKILDINITDPIDPTIAPYNYDRRKDYTILYDRSHILAGVPIETSTYITGIDSYKLGKANVYQKSVNKVIQFGEVQTTNDGKNHIGWIFVTDSAITPSPSISITSQLIYTDA